MILKYIILAKKTAVLRDILQNEFVNYSNNIM